jgi:hypothetical protein
MKKKFVIIMLVLSASFIFSACQDDSQEFGDRGTNPEYGKADDIYSDTTRSIIQFRKDFSEEVIGNIAKGKTVVIHYDLQRMYKIANWQDGSGQFFDNEHGCGDNICCEVKFEGFINAHYRVHDNQAFQEVALWSIDHEPEIDIPAGDTDVDELEIYVVVDGYSIRAWDCSDEQTTQQNYEQAEAVEIRDYTWWDSRYGNNYKFAIADAPSDDDTNPSSMISFSEDMSAPRLNGELKLDGEVTVKYDRKRMYEIIKWTDPYGTYWASEHHCYGYGCCRVSFPEVYVSMMVNDSSSEIITLKLDDNDTATFDVPPLAWTLSFWADVKGYDLESWFCGNESNSHTRWVDYEAWDSNYGKNFWFFPQM